jgi:hypothetical protein
MCATVCPSQALFFGTREQIDQLRPMSVPTNQFQFGNQTITTQVAIMVPRRGATRSLVNVTDAMEEKAAARNVSLTVMPATEHAPRPGPAPADDPFAEVEV